MNDLVFDPAFWQQHVTLFAGAVLLLSLIIGSFLNVVILRLPMMMEHAWRRECQEMLESDVTFSNRSGEPVSLMHPPSTCPKCGHLIRAWENVPVISYLVLRGRCAQCREPISARYPVVESLTAVLSVVVAVRFGATPVTVAMLILTWSLVALAIIDIDHQLLPDSITLPLLWLGLIINSGGLIVPLEQSVWGAILGYLSLWSVYWGFKLLTGKDGMGYGDFKLLAAAGAWLGWKALPVIIILSSFAGAVIGLCLILIMGRDRNVPIPFGPYLAIAAWMTAMWGEELVDTYQMVITAL